ncbi:YopT-type cysteine protease domain-containing protein [uncultured Erythrobacter sp.]|uniref:YopT-type cysteine protease domain-containing protein n=1 Tax=uncultured Erythrobacter sp. TaxID=263913 RepID=UPI002633F40C|nr:YopT-type cysteine protease domain-containing protein [uncultured Erythrobacter sp.]
MPGYKQFVSEFSAETVFLQTQGYFEDDDVDKGVCAALSYMWASENLDGTFKLDEWRPRETRFKFSGVPMNSGIGKQFPDLVMPTIHAQKVKPGSKFVQKLYEVEFRTSSGDAILKIGRKDGRLIKRVAKISGNVGGADVGENLKRYKASFLNGYGILTFSMKKGGHAVAFQATEGQFQLYDANLGHFKTSSWRRMKELISSAFQAADYNCRNLSFYSVGRVS